MVLEGVPLQSHGLEKVNFCCFIGASPTLARSICLSTLDLGLGAGSDVTFVTFSP